MFFEEYITFKISVVELYQFKVLEVIYAPSRQIRVNSYPGGWGIYDF
jgi:hypothetical protein